jgi:hypothetical protein
MKKVIIAGGTGFIGQELIHRFEQNGYKVLIISREAGNVLWSDKNELKSALNDADLVLNLAGKSVNCRFTEKNKEALLSSRIITTKQLGEAIANCQLPPKLWINASGASIYPSDSTEVNTEDSSTNGKSFMAEVARQWEQTFFSFKLSATRQIALRVTLVLGKSGGVFPIFKKLAQFGLGGSVGSGNQKMSWIHIDDLYNILLHLMAHPDIVGPVNCGAPHVPGNSEFMHSLRKTVGMPFGVPAPAFAIKFASPVIDIEPSLLLDSMWVKPSVLEKSGYQFKFSELNSALKDLNNL